MTKVTFSLQEDKILAVDILGHAGYAEEGEDIVCAAISSAVMLTHALLYDVQHIPVDTLIEDDGAHIRFTLPKGDVERRIIIPTGFPLQPDFQRRQVAPHRTQTGL